MPWLLAANCWLPEMGGEKTKAPEMGAFQMGRYVI